MLSQLSIGSMNVVSQRYVSSSVTWTDLRFNFVNGPFGLWVIVILKKKIKKKKNFIKIFLLNIKREMKVEKKHQFYFFHNTIMETLQTLTFVQIFNLPDRASIHTSFHLQQTHWRISPHSRKKNILFNLFE